MATGSKQPQTYKVKTPLTFMVKGEIFNYGVDEVADNVPGESVHWLLDQGHIEAVSV